MLVLTYSATNCQEMLENETAPFFSTKGFDSEDGNVNLSKYISETMNYPEEAKYNCISGTVLIQFVIDSLGNVVSESLLFENNLLLVKESKRTFYSTSGHWVPATQNGKKVSMQMTIPFRFSLRDAGCKTETDYFQFGLGYFEQQDYTMAVKSFKLALRQDPYNSDYLYNLTASYLKQYKIDSACYYLNVLPINDDELEDLKSKFCEEK